MVRPPRNTNTRSAAGPVSRAPNHIKSVPINRRYVCGCGRYQLGLAGFSKAFTDVDLGGLEEMLAGSPSDAGSTRFIRGRLGTVIAVRYHSRNNKMGTSNPISSFLHQQLVVDGI